MQLCPSLCRDPRHGVTGSGSGHDPDDARSVIPLSDSLSKPTVSLGFHYGADGPGARHRRSFSCMYI